MNLVAIIGRPNVGKSTLFNRLVEKKKAITGSEEGITRDRNYDISTWNGHTFTLIDTGGYIEEGVHFEKAIREQIAIAIEEADAILFIVDCKTGILSSDHTIAKMLRKSNKRVIVVANKADNPTLIFAASSFHSLGIEAIYPISAAHGTGTGDLMDAITETMGSPLEKEEKELPRITFIGRPNVGKSTFVNALLPKGKERSIVSEEAHTTRDALDTHYRLYGKELIITDTAGIYKKKKDKESITFYSVIRSVKAIHQSDVCILLISAEEGLTKQDFNIMHLARRHRKGLILLVNKWDKVDKQVYDANRYRRDLATELGTMGHLPILFTSGLKNQRIYDTLTQALKVYENMHRKIPTPLLNKVMLEAISLTPPPVVKGKLLKINYVVQLPRRQPIFSFFCNLPQYVQPSYKRYLEKKIRAHFDFKGVPITLFFVKK